VGGSAANVGTRSLRSAQSHDLGVRATSLLGVTAKTLAIKGLYATGYPGIRFRQADSVFRELV
jgi:hypothetical protein